MRTQTYLSKDKTRLVYWDLDADGRRRRWERPRNRRAFFQTSKFLKPALAELTSAALDARLVELGYVPAATLGYETGGPWPGTGRSLDGSRAMSQLELVTLYEEAHAAGMVAGRGAQVALMVVEQHDNVLDDTSPVVQRWTVPEGLCGFAWVNVPGNTRLGRWLKETGRGSIDSYYGGVTVWVSEFNQSHARKVAYARAFAGVLEQRGVARVHVGERLD